MAMAVYLVAGNLGGPETAEVPNVLGKSRNEADNILRAGGFEVEVKTRRSSEENAGEVVQQSPSGGEAEEGSEVAITVGKASRPEKETAPEEAVGPAPGYGLVQDPTGSLTVEVPTDWTVLKG